MTFRMMLADPTGQIERECADKRMRQSDVALTYALAIRDAAAIPVDWGRANAAIAARWPRGLARVKTAAWKIYERGERAHPGTEQGKGER